MPLDLVAIKKNQFTFSITSMSKVAGDQMMGHNVRADITFLYYNSPSPSLIMKALTVNYCQREGPSQRNAVFNLHDMMHHSLTVTYS